VSSKLVVAAIVFMIVAPPMVLYVWQIVDQVLSGNFRLIPVVAALVVAFLFIAAAYGFGRIVRTETGEQHR
jgi:hypothetical protein